MISDDSISTSLKTSSAVLMGYEYILSGNRNVNWQFKSNVRFFGRDFNNNFIEESERYGFLNRPTSFSGNKGDFLYPLINSYRDFDQWSVYTEYQSEQLLSISFLSDVELKIYGDLFGSIVLETNIILTENTDNAYYYFYTAGLRYKLPANTNFEVFATNKIMNMDIHYPTFYQAKIPVIGFSIKRLLGYK